MCVGVVNCSKYCLYTYLLKIWIVFKKKKFLDQYKYNKINFKIIFFLDKL